MSIWMNVAEKPSVAKEVAHVLSKGTAQTTESLSRFNPVFQFRMGGVQMLFTSVAGHLTEDDFPPNAKSWNSFPMAQLFTVPITKTVKEEFQQAKKNLEALAKRSTHIVLWLDCDREGENICFEVLDVVLKVNRRLEVKRSHFSALTERDLLHAVSHLQAPNKFLSDAVETRREMDLRIGAVFTRFQTVRFRDQFQNMPKVLSFGPCQFPTMGFVVRRHWEREAFVAQDFYHATLVDGSTRFQWSHGHVFDLTTAVCVFEEMCSDASSSVSATGGSGVATITEVEQKQTLKHPPPPLATVQLQKLASQHLRISAEQCMSLAETLYQQGYLSYPRTETDQYSFTDDELVALAAIQVDNMEVGDYASRLVAQREQRYHRPKVGGHNDNAHPPIHPTKLMTENQGGDSQHYKLYQMVVRHFLACMSPPAVAASVHVAASYGNVPFHTSGQTVVDKGWLEVFPYERWNTSANVPNYTVGATFVPAEVSLEHGRTEPPQLITESGLITLMDQFGIGTDATIAQHIKTVLERDYISREGSVLKATPLGLALTAAFEVAGLPELTRPELRAQMELAMSDIARGAATKEQVLDAAVEMYREKFNKLCTRVHIFEEELRKHLCPAGTDANAGGATTQCIQRNFTPCGRCNRPMELIQETVQQRSTGFVKCGPCGLQLRVPMHGLIQLSNANARCPLCQFGVINITNTDKNTTHTVCSYCFSNPPPLPDVEVTGEFRCFQCTADCPLAKGADNVSIVPCPGCQKDHLRLRKGGTAQKFFLACKTQNCQFTVGLPPAESVRPMPESRCPLCNGTMLSFKFSFAQQIPLVEAEEVMCIGCDQRLSEYLTIRGAPHQQPAAGGGQASNQTSRYVMPTVAPRGGRGAGARGAGRGGRGGATTAGGAAAGAATCHCGVAAKRLVSRQPKSAGKAFLTCGKDKACDFFQWIDDC